MNHSFDVDIAIKFGVPEAVLIENFRFWIAKNKANGRHFHKGRHWTYNSTQAMTELFPYWSQDQIRRTLRRMEDAGILLSDNFNNNPYDRTKWYSLSDIIDVAKSPNGKDETAESTIHTDINTDVNQRAAQAPAAQDKPARVSRGDKTLATYLAQCKESGVKAIPDDHHIRRYMRDAGITGDMAVLAWERFREEHTTGTRKAKRYTDWPGAFANSVKDRWYRLWAVNADGDANWTNEGLQAKRVFEAQQNESMGESA